MFKRYLLILAILFWFWPALIAYADAVYESENDFFNQHIDECVYLGRNFMLNGGDGSVSVTIKPGSDKEIAVVENGIIVYIQYSCLYKGEYWGISGFSVNEKWLDGWVRMDELLVLYDYISFDEEHSDEYYTYEGDYDEIKKAGGAVVWQWPGSGDPLWTVEGLDAESFGVSRAWMDKDGREWGYVLYLYGNRDIWICLSDPLNNNIPAFNPAPEPSPWVSDTGHSDTAYSGNAALPLIIVLVAGLAAGTVFLIRMVWKRK